MLIGSINNWGEIQGQINNANGVLTGVITNAGQLGGQVVGMRGLKGDKGDTGDTGATGNGIASVTYVSSAGLVDTYKITYTDGTETTFDITNGEDGTDGTDGHSPVVTASKVGKVTTVYVDGTAIATINDGEDGEGTITDVTVNGTSVLDGSVAKVITHDVPSGGTVGQVLTKDSSTDYDTSWQDPSGGTITDVTVDGVSIVTGGVAELETVTQLRDGIMTATDKQKLDGIASGAEVNVQSDWNQATNTADDYIKNKPTIPTDTSELTNGAGYITGVTSTETPTADTIAEFDSNAHMNSTDMSAQDVSDFVDSLNVSGASILDMFYPVGSYYETSDGTFDPNIAWGGTWSLETAGQVHVSAGTGYTLGDTGGEKTHTLTTVEMPAHGHNAKTWVSAGTLGAAKYYTNYGRTLSNAPNGNQLANGTWKSSSFNCAQSGQGDNTGITDMQGGGSAHNNMQPYRVAICWHRTA